MNEEKDKIAKELFAMISTPGWGHLKKYLSEKADSSFSLHGINLEKDDVAIAQMVRIAKAKRDIYMSIELWVKDRIKKGGINYG